MASLPFSVAELHSILAQEAPQELARSIPHVATMLQLFPFREAPDKRGIRWQTIDDDNDSVAFAAVGADLAAPDAETYTEAVLSFGNLFGSFRLAHRQILQSDNSQLLVNNLIDEQLDAVVRKMGASLHTSLISGDGTSNDMVGTTVAVQDDNTYAGIDRTSASYWQSPVYDNSGSGRTLSAALMEAAIGTFYNSTGVDPNAAGFVALCDYQQYDNIIQLTTGTAPPRVAASPGNVPALISSTSAFVQNIPVIRVPGYTAGRIDFVRREAVEVQYLANAPAPGGIPDNDSAMMLGAGPFHILEPTRSGQNWDWTVAFYGQMRLKNPPLDAFSLQDLNN